MRPRLSHRRTRWEQIDGAWRVMSQRASTVARLTAAEASLVRDDRVDRNRPGSRVVGSWVGVSAIMTAGARGGTRAVLYRTLRRGVWVFARVGMRDRTRSEGAIV